MDLAPRVAGWSGHLNDRFALVGVIRCQSKRTPRYELLVLNFIQWIWSVDKAAVSARRELLNLSIAGVTAFGVSALWFWLTWRYGLDLADEGFYWYGAQRVAAGEVPLRDFMAYDIGRYYWAAAFMRFLEQDGLFVARLSAAIYQSIGTLIGVYLSLFALRRQGSAPWVFALLVALILTILVTPYYKAYDHATSIMIVGICVILLKSTHPSAWLIAGVWLGLAAVMGRNHGVYGAAASILTVAFLIWNKSFAFKQAAQLSRLFVLGVAIGFSPNLWMMIAVKGFSPAFWQSILEIFEYGGTNIPLPVPWIWTVELSDTWIVHLLMHIGIGLGFVFLIAFLVIGVLLLVSGRFIINNNWKALFAAATFSAIPYAHYAFSRADLAHLTLGIMPATIGVLAIAGVMKGRQPNVLAGLILAMSIMTVPKGLILHRLFDLPHLLTDVGGDDLWVDQPMADRLSNLLPPLAEVGRNNGNFLAVPDMPGLHAVMRNRMPIWEIYALFPVSQEFESREIAGIESMRPDLIIVSNHALDGRPDLRYSSTHPITYDWITTHYALSDLVNIGELKSYSRREP